VLEVIQHKNTCLKGNEQSQAQVLDGGLQGVLGRGVGANFKIKIVYVEFPSGNTIAMGSCHLNCMQPKLLVS